MTVKRMDNVSIVVESLDSAISFFTELGLELEGRATIEGDWAGRVTGLRDQRVEIAGPRECSSVSPKSSVEPEGLDEVAATHDPR